MKKTIFIIIFIFNWYNMNGQNLHKDALRASNDVDIWKNSLYKSIGVITYKDGNGRSSLGTGTLISKSIKESGGKEGSKIYLITNKHVLPDIKDSKNTTFKISAPWLMTEEKFIDVNIPIYKEDGALFDYVKFNPKGEDVAVIDFTSFFMQNKLDSLANDLAPFEMLATKSILKERNITIGDPIYFIGYPSFFFNNLNATPLLRIGAIATNPLEDYYFNDFLKEFFNLDKIEGFLIDASVFGGSSGSLVILKSQYSQMYNGDIKHSLQKAIPYILGILTNSFPSYNSNDNFQKLNIGGVINSEAIIETIEEF